MIISNAWLRDFFSQDGAITAMSLSRRLRWKFRNRFALFGWPGVLAMALIAVSPLFYFSIIHPMQTRLDETQRSLVVTQKQQIIVGNVAHGADTPREQLTEFYNFFPKEKIAPKWLGKLVAVAEQNGLSLDEGEYKVTSDKVGQMLRYKITLPVQGKYPQIRKFLASLPTKIPPMALENVQFQRKDIVESTVQVKIMLVLFLVQES